jgi:hypothetical protein
MSNYGDLLVPMLVSDDRGVFYVRNECGDVQNPPESRPSHSVMTWVGRILL